MYHGVMIVASARQGSNHDHESKSCVWCGFHPLCLPLLVSLVLVGPRQKLQDEQEKIHDIQVEVDSEENPALICAESVQQLK